MQPDHLQLSENGAALRVEWPGGADIIPASKLRASARDAHSLRQKIETGEIRVAPDLRITGYQIVGVMGLNIHFSDGHDRAIYPWHYLRDIAQGAVN